MLDDILVAEQEILETLQYSLISNTSQRFLFNFATFFPLEPKAFILCNYLLELTLLDTTYLRFPNGIVALSCLYVCGKVLRRDLSVEKIT